MKSPGASRLSPWTDSGCAGAEGLPSGLNKAGEARRSLRMPDVRRRKWVVWGPNRQQLNPADAREAQAAVGRRGLSPHSVTFRDRGEPEAQEEVAPSLCRLLGSQAGKKGTKSEPPGWTRGPHTAWGAATVGDTCPLLPNGAS